MEFDQPAPELFHIWWVLAALIPVAIQVVLFLSALVSILRSQRYTGGGKLLWAAVVFFAPFLGPLGWWLGGRRAQIRTTAP